MKKEHLLRLLYLLYITFIITACSNKDIPIMESDTDTEKISLSKEYTITEPYIYPVLPGTDEWLKLETTENRMNSCTVSNELMSKMTTDALVQTVVTYPFFVNWGAYDGDYDRGLEAISEYFGGIKELLSRDDAYESVLLYIKNKCPDLNNIYNDDELRKNLGIYEEAYKENGNLEWFYVDNAIRLITYMNYKAGKGPFAK